MRNIIFPLVLGIGGCAILLWLGFWQLDRLAWKEGILDDIDAKIAAEPTPVPQSISRANDNYRSVAIAGRPTGQELHVLTSGTAAGTGFRVISEFETLNGATLLVDLGLLPLDQKAAAPSINYTEITGNLIWPDDKNSATADPNLEKNEWYARDVVAMAEHLGTLPIMVVAATSTTPDPRLTLLPVNSANIKNDHLNYAITWFLLAAVWAGMTFYLIRRTRQEDAT